MPWAIELWVREYMYSVVKQMVDNICEVAKQELKRKNDYELGSWERVVAMADGMLQTRGWHSIHNYDLTLLPPPLSDGYR